LPRIIDLLLDGVDDTRIHRCIVGLNWTLVETEFGCGLAHTPAKNSAGCEPVETAGYISNKSLTSVARYATSNNPVEVSIGVAAINAYYNRYDVTADGTNGLETLNAKGKDVAVIGRFPDLEKRGFNPKIIELYPRDGEYSFEDAGDVIESCSQVLVTASTLINGTLEKLLELSRDKELVLVGPSTPLAPLLFNHGINTLSGIVITDAQLAAQIVSEGGSVKALKTAGRYATLRNL